MLMNVDLGILILRAVVGLVFFGHGAQKLLGWFGGKGLAGHTSFMENLNVHPSRFWAVISALSEFLGGLGLAFGFLTPLAAAALVGSMLVAIVRVHWARGFWNGNGGIELPLVLAVAALVVGLTGSGVYSLDHAMGLVLPEPATYLLALIAMLVVVLVALAPVHSIARQEHHTA